MNKICLYYRQSPKHQSCSWKNEFLSSDDELFTTKVKNVKKHSPNSDLQIVSIIHATDAAQPTLETAKPIQTKLLPKNKLSLQGLLLNSNSLELGLGSLVLKKTIPSNFSFIISNPLNIVPSLKHQDFVFDRSNTKILMYETVNENEFVNLDEPAVQQEQNDLRSIEIDQVDFIDQENSCSQNNVSFYSSKSEKTTTKVFVSKIKNHYYKFLVILALLLMIFFCFFHLSVINFYFFQIIFKF